MEKTYYKPAQKEASWLFEGPFKLHFPEIQNCAVFKNWVKKIGTFYQWKTKYENHSIPQDLKQLQQKLPIEKPNFQNQNGKLKYTWIGHSTAVISIGKNFTFIIDPIFSDYASPSQSLGPKRFRPIPCKVSELPKINSVFVSHDHYDHLDQHSLNQLQKTFKPTFFAGLRSKDAFPKNSKLIQLNWTQTVQHQVNGQIYKVTFVPVCHWGRRWLNDTNKRLWGGFVIQTPNKKKIFYSGDTGYCQIFKQLGQIFGAFDLAILPIGAYLPRQILGPQHIDPSQAVKIHKQLKSKKSIGVHWGTFPLGNQHWCQAREDLEKAKKDQGLKQDQFITINHGGSFVIDF